MIGEQKTMNTQIFLKLQEAMMVKLEGPYLKITKKSRSERRALLPVDDLGKEFAEFAKRYKKSEKDGE